MVLTTVKSETRPGVEYEIRISGGGQPYCLCPAWRFGQVIRSNGAEFKAPCKHLRRLGVTELHQMEVPSFVFRPVAV